MSTKPRILERTINGGAVFAIPGSASELLWLGPRAGIFFGEPRRPGGVITRVEHPSADATYDTLAEATAAVAAFIAVLSEPAVDGRAA